MHHIPALHGQDWVTPPHPCKRVSSARKRHSRASSEGQECRNTCRSLSLIVQVSGYLGRVVNTGEAITTALRYACQGVREDPNKHNAMWNNMLHLCGRLGLCFLLSLKRDSGIVCDTKKRLQKASAKIEASWFVRLLFGNAPLSSWGQHKYP